MLYGQRKWADTSSDRKGGHILRKNWETLRNGKLFGEWIEMLHRQRKRADTSNDKFGRQMNRNLHG